MAVEQDCPNFENWKDKMDESTAMGKLSNYVFYAYYKGVRGDSPF